MKMLTPRMIESSCTPEGDCMLWNHGVNDCGRPMAQHAGKCQCVRRVLLALHGVLVPKGMLVAVTCRNSHCLNRHHFLITTRAKLQKQLAAEGVFSRPDANAARTAGRRAGKGLKLNMAKAREIRGVKDTEAQQVTADRFGISKSMVQKIQRGDWWQEARPQASVFQLGAV